MKFFMTSPFADVINRTKFYLNPVRGFDSAGSNFWLSHRKEKSPLTHDLNYRSACDRRDARADRRDNSSVRGANTLDLNG